MRPFIHIVIRLSDKTYGLPSTVIRHNSLAFNHDAVWVGKPDRGFAASVIDQLNKQVREGYTTYLYIIDPDRSNPVAYAAELQAATLKSPPDKELIPSFYKELKILRRMKAWFKVGYLDAFKLEEFEALDQTNTSYDIQEMEAIKRGVKVLPGGFELIVRRKEQV